MPLWMRMDGWSREQEGSCVCKISREARDPCTAVRVTVSAPGSSRRVSSSPPPNSLFCSHHMIQSTPAPKFLQKAHSLTDLEGISPSRKFLWCDTLAQRTTELLIDVCSECTLFHLVCCQHRQLPDHKTRPCHHYPALFVHGACAEEGEIGATAGVGGLFGGKPESRWSMRVGDELDAEGPRTAQRAELLAALAGLERFAASVATCPLALGKKLHVHPECVVVSDSEYLVTGVTEWFPTWRVRRVSLAASGFVAVMLILYFEQSHGWKNSKRQMPANLDLFHRIDKAVTELEGRHIKVGFWRVSRKVCVPPSGTLLPSFTRSKLSFRFPRSTPWLKCWRRKA